MKERLFRRAGRGSLIGLLGGLFTAVAMLLFLFVYFAAHPDAHIGSTAVLAPLSGIGYAVFGLILGAAGGAVAESVGFTIKGPLRCGLFGAILMGAIGLLSLLNSYYASPERFARSPMLVVGLCVVCGILGGAGSGAIVGMFSRGSLPNQTVSR